MHGYDRNDRAASSEDESKFINPALAWASGGIVSTPEDVNRVLPRLRRRRSVQRQGRPQSQKPASSTAPPRLPGPGRNDATLGLFRYQTALRHRLRAHRLLPRLPAVRRRAARNGRRSVVFSVNSQIVPGQGSPRGLGADPPGAGRRGLPGAPLTRVATALDRRTSKRPRPRLMVPCARACGWTEALRRDPSWLAAATARAQPGQRRHGDGLARPRQSTGPPRRDQDPVRGDLRRRVVLGPLRARGADRGRALPPSPRLGLRLRLRGRAPVSGQRVRRRLEPRAAAATGGARPPTRSVARRHCSTRSRTSMPRGSSIATSSPATSSSTAAGRSC